MKKSVVTCMIIEISLVQAVLLLAIILASIFVLSRNKIFYGQLQKLRLLRASKLDEGIQVSSIYVHPVKSLRPVSVESAKFTQVGLEGDRSIMLVRSSATLSNQCRFLTQRQCPTLATINASLPKTTHTSDGVKTTIELSDSNRTKNVVVDISPQSLLTRPLQYNAGLWDEKVTVVDLGYDASTFIQSFIRTSEDSYDDVRLVAQLPNESRRVNANYCPPSVLDVMGRSPKVSLSDGYPLLICSEESLAELNRRLRIKGKEDLHESRFRPNIVIKGAADAFAEDRWKAIQIGEKGPILHIVKACPRCKMSCTDQLTGERFDEPLETLKEFRALGKDNDDVFFAQNAVMQPGDDGKEICVGDCVYVLETGDPIYE